MNRILSFTAVLLFSYAIPGYAMKIAEEDLNPDTAKQITQKKDMPRNVRCCNCSGVSFDQTWLSFPARVFRPWEGRVQFSCILHHLKSITRLDIPFYYLPKGTLDQLPHIKHLNLSIDWYSPEQLKATEPYLVDLDLPANIERLYVRLDTNWQGLRPKNSLVNIRPFSHLKTLELVNPHENLAINTTCGRIGELTNLTELDLLLVSGVSLEDLLFLTNLKKLRIMNRTDYRALSNSRIREFTNLTSLDLDSVHYISFHDLMTLQELVPTYVGKDPGDVTISDYQRLIEDNAASPKGSYDYSLWLHPKRDTTD